MSSYNLLTSSAAIPSTKITLNNYGPNTRKISSLRHSLFESQIAKVKKKERKSNKTKDSNLQILISDNQTPAFFNRFE